MCFSSQYFMYFTNATQKGFFFVSSQNICLANRKTLFNQPIKSNTQDSKKLISQVRSIIRPKTFKIFNVFKKTKQKNDVN